MRTNSPPPILIVSPELHVVALLSHKLDQAGFALQTTETAEHAFELVRDETPALIIAAMRLPDLDGRLFCAALAECPRTATIPVIGISDRPQWLPSDSDPIANVKAVYTKPFSVRDVLSGVRELLKLRAAA